jgi:hypothetical protein
LKNKALGILLLLALFVACFVLINVLHFRLFPVHVVLYDSLIDVAIAATLVLIAYYVGLRPILRLTNCEAVLTIGIGLLLGVNYAITVPTIIDRSLSIYILEKLAQKGGSVRYEAFGDIVRNEYLPEHQLVDIRLTEQLNSGTISIVDNCVLLTARGERIAKFTRFFRKNFLPKKREIMGTYTDALTDPFRNSRNAVEAGCGTQEGRRRPRAGQSARS